MVTPAPDAAQSQASQPVTGNRIGEVDGIARLDLDRRRRTAVPEVVFAEGKTEEQTLQLLAAQRRGDPGFPALATRCPAGVLQQVPARFPGEPVVVDPVGRTVIVGALPPTSGLVAVLTGGTSDLPVAQEAVAAARSLGTNTSLIADVGVAGIHRLLRHRGQFADPDCIVVAAGMDGALPSVVAGLVGVPVVGLPTSVGYGASFGGVAALLAMLNACAPGVGVVNIDNGYGAGHLAAQIAAPQT